MGDALLALGDRGLHCIETRREFAEFVVGADVHAALIVAGNHAPRRRAERLERSCDRRREPAARDGDEYQQRGAERHEPTPRFHIGLHGLLHGALQDDEDRRVAANERRLYRQRLVAVRTRHIHRVGTVLGIDARGVGALRRDEFDVITRPVQDGDIEPGEVADAIGQGVVDAKTHHDPSDRDGRSQGYGEKLIGRVGQESRRGLLSTARGGYQASYFIVIVARRVQRAGDDVAVHIHQRREICADPAAVIVQH